MSKLKVTWHIDLDHDADDIIKWTILHRDNFSTPGAVIARTPYRQFKGSNRRGDILSLNLKGVAAEELVFVSISLDRGEYIVKFFNVRHTELYIRSHLERSYSV